MFDSGEKWQLNEETSKVRRLQPPPDLPVDLPITNENDVRELVRKKGGLKSPIREVYRRDGTWEVETFSAGVYLVDAESGDIEHMRS